MKAKETFYFLESDPVRTEAMRFDRGLFYTLREALNNVQTGTNWDHWRIVRHKYTSAWGAPVVSVVKTS
jgi:hypothetical protein